MARPVFAGFAIATAAEVVLPVPFAQAALWASDLPELRACDQGVGDGCPAQPEHGGAGFLSTVFTWRYILNNLRVLVAKGALTMAREHTIMGLLLAMDKLMEMPFIEHLADITLAARQLLTELRPYLEIQPPLLLAFPKTPLVPRWSWPHDATFVLRGGVRMPALGFGTWRLWAKAAYEPVRWALAAGYRHIDTAEGYANEAEVGRAIADSLVKREEIFIATKASSVPKGLADLSLAEQIFDFQLKQLGTDYVDVYMLHTPPVQPELLEPLWRVMEHFQRQGRARALGVSNCDVEDLKKILSLAEIAPAYVQNLFKIYKPGEQLSSSEDVVAFAQAHGMVVVGYSVQTEWPHVMSPLADPHVLALSASLRRTPSQVLHRWALQRGVAVIPKSSSKQRIEENFEVLDFQLDEAAMQWLDGLATLSESGGELKPYGQEDVFGLFGLQPGSPSHSSDGSSVDKGFPYLSIRDHILATFNEGPQHCRQRCLQEPSCAAWEVCNMEEAGCQGCYLIGEVAAAPIYIPGWHAAVERKP